MSIIPHGIDLATTYCSVAIYNRRGGPRVIKDNSSKSTIRSMISFNENGSISSGSEAESHRPENLSSTVYDMKRMFGQPFSSPIIDYNKKNWTFEVEKAPDSDQILINIPSQNKKMRPVEVTSILLNHLIETSNKSLPKDKKNRQAVITVPANFTEIQRDETMEAAKLANIEVLGLLNEPTAACMACAYVNDFLYENTSSKVLIYDFGAGTLDVSLAQIENPDMKDKLYFDIIAIEGDNHLGGRDFDDIIFNYVVDKLNLDRNNKRLMFTAMQSVIDAKIYLSMQDEADILIYGSTDYKMKITRKKFEELTSCLINRCINPVKKVLEVAKMSVTDIDHIILTGGSSHMPFVKEKLTQFFGKEPFEGVDPQEAVAKGAAIVAYNKANNIEKHIDNFVVYRDIASRSIGIALDNGKMSFHVRKNQTLPISSHIIYDNQSYEEGLSICIFEGENEECKMNDYLGKFEIHGIPLSPQGRHKIKVTFTMNDNGIIHVDANLIDSSIHASITVVRYIGNYPEKLCLEKQKVLYNINKNYEDPVIKLYRMALAYVKASENDMHIFLGHDLYDTCLKEFNYGVNNLSCSTSTVAQTKDKILSLLGNYFTIHRNLPSFLQN